MKKFTLIAALLGSAYFAQAQVGINTDAPKTSSYLDVTASDKGILIPRVKLTATTVFSPIVGEEVESLLVYNEATAGTGATAVKPGFYYWKKTDTGTAYWERVASATDLKELIEGVDADLTSILELLKQAYPSNNLEGKPTGGKELGGGMVYEPGDGTVANPPTISYVHYDAASNTYVKKDITSDIQKLINGAESKTLLVKNAKYQYYVSEAYLLANNSTPPTQTVVDGWTDTTFDTGVYYIDVIGGVVNNFETLVTNKSVTIGGKTYTSIEQYIEEISQNTMQDGVTKIVIDNNEATFQTWNATTKQWVNVDNSVFKKIVADNETVTTLTKAGTTGAIGDEIKYTYVSEDGTTTVVTLTADVLNSIVNNEDIKKEITKIINAGGNVYFGDHDDDIATPDVFYTINPTTGVKVPVDISGTVVNAITNLNSKQTNIVKNELGDVINNSSNTSVFTGDTYVDNGTTYYIYKGEFTTTVTANTARTTGVTLDKSAHKIMTITLDYGNGTTASLTDTIIASGTNITFNVGVGNTYHVLNTTEDITAKVLVEFASVVKPTGL